MAEIVIILYVAGKLIKKICSLVVVCKTVSNENLLFLTFFYIQFTQ